jgi:putative NADPH-quinone reductase
VKEGVNVSGAKDLHFYRYGECDWEHGAVPPSLLPVQQAILEATHLVFLFPYWLGDMPALLKALLEQVARPGFAFRAEGGNPFAHKTLAGRSARVVVTMGMPATVYRWYFQAHAVKSLERNILGFVGIAPVRRTLIGMLGKLDARRADKWLGRMRAGRGRAIADSAPGWAAPGMARCTCGWRCGGTKSG